MKARKKVEMKDNFDIEKIKKEQVEKIKDSIKKVVNEDKNYYKDKKTIIISFGYYIKDYAKRVSDWDGREETKPRELLQQLGIELIKNKIDDKLFINRIIEDIEIFSYFYDIIIV